MRRGYLLVGFTLIEMVIVVGLVSLISAVVLVVILPARNQAKDSRIIADAQRVRTTAETFYVRDGDYSNLPARSVSSDDPALGSIAADINNQGGTLVIDKSSDNSSYRAYSNLSDGYYCVNSLGVSLRGRGSFPVSLPAPGCGGSF